MRRPVPAALFEPLVVFGLLIALSGVPSGSVRAAEWPDRPVKLVVPFPPGNAPDVIARILAERFTATWGQPVVVENVPGAAGNIGVERVSKAAPDGYTLVISGDAAIVVNRTLYCSIGYDSVRDLTPISQIGITANVLVVNPQVPANTVAELLALARARPGQLNLAHAGYGTSQHVGAELLRTMGGISFTQVPYREPYMSDLLANHVNMAFMNVVIALPQVQASKLRPLAVSGTERLPTLPNIPTMAEAGLPGFNAVAWFGLLAPARTPDPVIRKASAATVAALAEPAIRTRLEGLGVRIVGSTPEEFVALIHAEIPRMAKVIADSGIKVE